VTVFTTDGSYNNLKAALNRTATKTGLKKTGLDLGRKIVE